MNNILRTIKHYVPDSVFHFFQPLYHFLLTLGGALAYRFPAKKLTVIGVTGTKGKTSVTEVVNAILEEAGHTTALSNTVRFKIGSKSRRNKKKMTMPGRAFLQRFFRHAVNAGCDYAVIEMTSQGVLQSRHKFVYPDAIVFTNLAPEHIEAHGSYEQYRNAKLEIARSLEESPKPKRVMVANADDKEGGKFLSVDVDEKRPFSLEDARPFTVNDDSIKFTYDTTEIQSPLGGKFNLYNMLAAIEVARSQGISMQTIKRALESFGGIPGRLQKIKLPPNAPKELQDAQDFTVVVDYAHTPDSLESVYRVFEGKKKVCVLGNTGGGRDKWKRKSMAKIAENYCQHIILTNEDPYDEDPRAIVDDMARVISIPKYNIIMDRRRAIRSALEHADDNDVVLITGKGTDPYIMGPDGTKQPWDDASVVRQELNTVLHSRIQSDEVHIETDDESAESGADK